MILSRMTSTQNFTIKQPRWRDRVVLLANYKIGTHNSIIFTETKSMPGEYYISGANVTKHPLSSNGRIKCYAVPLDELQPLERET